MRIQTFLSIITSLLLFLIILPKTVFAAASIQITVVTDTGAPIANHPITCIIQRPTEGHDLPKPPLFTYLETNRQGMAFWQPEVTSGNTYQCSSRSALSPDNCFYINQSSSGSFSLSEGEAKQFTFSGIPAPDTCGTTLSTEEDIINNHMPAIAPLAEPTTEPVAEPTAVQTEIPGTAPDTSAPNSRPNDFDPAKSTDLNAVADLSQTADFKLATTEQQLEYLEIVDLSFVQSSEFNLKDVVIFTPTSISVDSDKAPALNKPAKLTFSNLPFAGKPDILYNGQVASDHIQNYEYDASTRTVSFQANGFSTYEVVPAHATSQTTFVFITLIIILTLTSIYFTWKTFSK